MKSSILLLPTAGAYHFNPFQHSAGIAPYFTPNDPPIPPSPPQGCNVTRAAYRVRHAAIYANDFDYETYIEPFIQKLHNTTQNWTDTDALSFLSTWTAPITEDHLEMLTRVGLQEATNLGASFRQRYPSLKTNKVWSSTADRTVKSAQGFISGYTNNETHVDLIEVPESSSVGADSLTPYKSCPAYSSSYGSEFQNDFVQKYTPSIATRLNTLAPTFNFTASDITAMFELCGYETVIRGSSPFCSAALLSPTEWLSFEYANDLMYFHNTGYGRPVNPRIGFPWVRTSYGLLSSPSTSTNTKANTTDTKRTAGESRDLYVSFTHREFPPTVITALGLFNNTAYTSNAFLNASMPRDEVNYYRAWRSSRILPFLGNVGVERLECDVPGYADGGSGSGDEGVYFRVLVNGAVQPVVGCRDGPGASCSAGAFGEWMRGREEVFGDFGGVCGNGSAEGGLGIYG
ncbi:histidine acid phosphatase [Aspergillus ellipticus CBS 707.79]|uniref:Histidine acid phosphatase n=1 Tax=Aspergillus ellipticus CBS 707.79 TaxID=1448320 RepID=A0A319ECT6_9EURO|nr:histidine acid phosphatase [Aspergillus ellipticus CBS 707.79]